MSLWMYNFCHIYKPISINVDITCQCNNQRHISTFSTKYYFNIVLSRLEIKKVVLLLWTVIQERRACSSLHNIPPQYSVGETSWLVPSQYLILLINCNILRSRDEQQGETSRLKPYQYLILLINCVRRRDKHHGETSWLVPSQYATNVINYNLQEERRAERRDEPVRPISISYPLHNL